MRSVLVLVAVLAVSATAYDDELSLEGMKGLEIQAKTSEKLALVLSFVNRPGFDFLSLPHTLDDVTKVFVAADQLESFTNAMHENNIDYSVFVDNVKQEVEIERKQSLLRYRGSYSPLTFKKFPRHSEINTYLKTLAIKKADSVVLINIGRSYEGRDIYAIKITNGDGNKKPAVLIDAGIHAREWIAPTTALYAISQLAENVANKHLLENVDWYIVPSLNPDGYEYSHTTYRMQRKTRSSVIGSTCKGTDANRNFGLMWMANGASSDPCAETYAGPKAFSEPEARALRDFVLQNNDTIKVYLTLHSYGKYMLHPWGFTSELPTNEPTLRCVAVKAERALAAVRGTRYRIGSSTNILYPAAGGSDDWVMGVAGVDLAYTIELPPGGNLGFNPSASQIIPVGAETFEAIKVFSKYAEGTICH